MSSPSWTQYGGSFGIRERNAKSVGNLSCLFWSDALQGFYHVINRDRLIQDAHPDDAQAANDIFSPIP